MAEAIGAVELAKLTGSLAIILDFSLLLAGQPSI